MNREPKAEIVLNSWGLPALVGLLIVLQLTVPYRGWAILLVGLGGAWLFAFGWARWLGNSLNLTREIRYGWAQVGDRIEERFTLTNTSPIPAAWVEVVDHSTMPGSRGGRGTGVDGVGETTWRVDAECTRRGLFTIGPTELLTSDPFGVYSVSFQYPASLPFIVMPPVLSLPNIQVSPGGRAGEGRPRQTASERTPTAAGVRKYIPGDSLRSIHWRTSARRESLFVRLLDGTPSGDWWIFLDMDQRVHVGAGQESTMEHGVILAASLADRGLRARRAVGLVVQGEEWVWMPPRGGEGRRWEMLRALALVSPGNRPLSELLTQTGPALGQYASVIIITPNVEGDWIEALVPLLRRGAKPTVLLLDPVSFGGTGDVHVPDGLLADLDVAHNIISQDVLSRPEARPGQQGRWEWRVSGTGRAIPVRRPQDQSWRMIS